jgi:thiamine-phosphate pyrophosphorylase
VSDTRGGDTDPGARLPCVSEEGERRQARLEDARLYVVTDARRDRGDLEPFLRAVAGASADVLQLRDKTASDEELRAAGEVFRRICDETGALFVVNDRPDLALELAADGVHVGQQDAHPDAVRGQVGPDLLVGRSTHSPEQLDASGEEDVDYVAVGPVHATPTKEGRPAVGLGPVRHAAQHAPHPWFAIGGLNADNLEEALEAGARRIVVVRAVTEAADPAEATWALRRRLARYH